MSEWIKVTDYLPERSEHAPNFGRYLVVTTGGCVREARYLGGWEDAGGGLDVAYWQQLPKPPERENGFELWWKQQPGCLPGLDMRRFFHDQISRGSAKLIWNAAIAASKSDDFVP